MSIQQTAQREVTIVDLHIQNIQSVENAFRTVGARVKVAADATAIESADLLVLPGVGAFGAAAERLSSGRFRQAIRRHVLELHRPVIGLCLGMQLLADSSEEHGLHDGLGLIPGQVVRLQDAPPDFRVPNVGWRSVHFRPGADDLLPAALDGRSFYHVHSYHFVTRDPGHTVAVSRAASGEIASIVRRGTVVGTQFHPEKSQEAGLDLLHALLQQLH